MHYWFDYMATQEEKHVRYMYWSEDTRCIILIQLFSLGAIRFEKSYPTLICCFVFERMAVPFQ